MAAFPTIEGARLVLLFESTDPSASAKTPSGTAGVAARTLVLMVGASPSPDSLPGGYLADRAGVEARRDVSEVEALGPGLGAMPFVLAAVPASNIVHSAVGSTREGRHPAEVFTTVLPLALAAIPMPSAWPRLPPSEFRRHC